MKHLFGALSPLLFSVHVILGSYELEKVLQKEFAVLQAEFDPVFCLYFLLEPGDVCVGKLKDF